MKYAEHQYDVDQLIGEIDELTKENKALTEKVETLETELRDCRNELCLQCGRYTKRHEGHCDGCRWLGKQEAQP